MLKYKRVYILLFIGFAMLFMIPKIFALSSSAVDLEPEDVIRSIITTVVATVGSDREYFDEHHDKLYTLVDSVLIPHFDSKKISKFVLGRNWKQIEEHQQDEFEWLFTRSLIQMYALHILEYKPEYVIKFRPTDYSVCPDGPAVYCHRAVVTMLLHLNKNKTTTKFFLYRNPIGEWKIWNFSIEGINLGIAYRNTYASIIESDGIEGLLRRLRNKINR